MSSRPSTPGELRMEAHDVLDRLRRLDRSAHDGGRLTVQAIDEIAAALGALQRRIEVTARHYNHAWALQDVLAARRHLDDARVIVLGFVAQLRADP
ncbi:hypothetical protein [Patulibacter sp.]|uniref:hypothetical protein n=1 Tax=Patulibacter sp. TaxID=1912859 RepID=UPI0027193192|nr:hypothetical protein [Patulibacter sp.]MDO9410200.1 hypothetical protein [Patulibacter sp.]